MRAAAGELLTSDPTLEKHPTLAETLDRLDQAAKENISKS
jgi:hypothetical protein